MSEFDVSQTHILQWTQFVADLLLFVRCEELHGLVHCHVEDVVDVLSVVLHVEHHLLEAFAVASLAFQHQVGHELHLDRHGAFSLAFLAASALRVEREVCGGEAHLSGELLLRHQFAYLVVGAEISHGVAACGSADGVLVHELHFLDHVEVALQTSVLPWGLANLVKMTLEATEKDIADQCRFATAAHAGHYVHDVEGNLHIDALEVVLACGFHEDIVVPGASAFGNLDFF